MKLSVVIVNYNVKFFLAQCLHSLFKATEKVSTEVIVVDNASTDGSEAYITRFFPQVKYIYNTENVGFGRANNQAIRLCSGDYILLLNPDTILPEDNIDQVLDFMDQHPDSGACGVLMRSGDGKFLPESKRGYPSPSASFWRLSGMYRIFPDNPRFDGYYLSRYDMNGTHQVPVLAGAYMMIRSEAFDKSGLFDEDFFMYGEDIDLSCRIEKSGYKNYYLPYHILHYKGESTKKLSYKYVHVFYEAMEIFFRKHGEGYNPLSRLLVHTGIKMQCGIKLLAVASRKGLAHFVTVKEKEPRFIIFAHDDHIESIRKILKKNHLEGPHHFVVSNERSATKGHDMVIPGNHGFTHVVYDSTTFSYRKMLSLISDDAFKGYQLGIYHPSHHVLVTPGKNYQ